MKNVFIGKTVEEAKMKAAEEFGVSVSEISFTVLEEPKKGLFGLIKGDARVEAVYDSAESVASEPAFTAAEPVTETVSVPETTEEAVTEAPKAEKKFDGSKAEAAVEYILNIFDKMGVKAEYTYEETEDGVIINLNSDDTSFIIGRRGENLDAPGREGGDRGLLPYPGVADPDRTHRSGRTALLFRKRIPVKGIRHACLFKNTMLT